MSSIAFSMCAGLVAMTSGVQADVSGAGQSYDHYENDLFRKDLEVYFVQAEYLYWVVNEGALDYAVKMDHKAWSSNSFAVGHIHNAEYDWASGFRLAFGYFRAPHFWDMYLQYTYVPCYGSNEVHAHSDSDSGKYLNGTWSHPDVNTGDGAVALETAHSRINLNYHVLDYMASRRFFPNEHLRMNLFGGITSAFIYQKWNVYYEDTEDQHAKIRNKWQFEGVGLKAGMKVDWFLGYDIYFTGLASSGILSGWYRNSAYQRTQAEIPGTEDDNPIHNTKLHDTRLAYTAQFMGGFSWQKAYDALRVEVGAGYEFNIWANLHNIYRSSYANAAAAKETYINDSLMSLQGLTVRLNLDF